MSPGLRRINQEAHQAATHIMTEAVKGYQSREKKYMNRRGTWPRTRSALAKYVRAMQANVEVLRKDLGKACLELTGSSGIKS